MKRSFIILTVTAFACILLLFFLGKTSQAPVTQKIATDSTKSFDLQLFIKERKAQSTSQAVRNVPVLTEETAALSDTAKLTAIAAIWRDSANLPGIAAYYYGIKAKLDNSKKSLNFATQFYIDCIRFETDARLLDWESSEAIALFNKALANDPENVDLKIGRASCYVFGKGRNGDANQTMQGVQDLLAIVRADSTNMNAQLVLGIGGVFSGQFDKAIPRLEKVVTTQPDNLEAIIYLADAYAGLGKVDKAITWYNISKRLANNPQYSSEVDQRINELQKR